MLEVEVANLTKSYGDKTALDGISFSIGSGQVVGLLGRNGAGKSTTMNILTGYISATSGRVSVGGHDILSEGGKAKSVTGYLPEQPSFYPEMRVDEHLGFICDLKSVYKNKKNREEHIAGICERVGISGARRRMIRNLSKGYRQRVGFAAALVGHPKVIILDEPTAGLDPSQIIEIRKLIRECGRESTVIVSSHILFEIGTLCDRVIIIDAGRIIADDAPESLAAGMGSSSGLAVRIKGDPQKVSSALLGAGSVERVDRLDEAEPGVYEYIVTGREGRDIREDIFRALAEADLPLLSSRVAASLEDVFLRLTGSRGDGMEADSR